MSRRECFVSSTDIIVRRPVLPCLSLSVHIRSDNGHRHSAGYDIHAIDLLTNQNLLKQPEMTDHQRRRRSYRIMITRP